MVGTDNGLGIFNVVGLNDEGFFDKSFGSGIGNEGSCCIGPCVPRFLTMGARGGIEVLVSTETDCGNSCLTSVEVDGRLIVIVGNAGGTRIIGSFIPF